MATIQINKYKRPGVFVQEIDQSQLPSTQASVINTMVIGFSKKGVINSPVLLNTAQDLLDVYGPIDRGLEKQGSFFHRTLAQMLQSSPVYGLNLLLTDDNLDLVQYQSMSGAVANSNDILRVGPYSQFFTKTGFWSRDTDSFLFQTAQNAGDDTRVLHFTNLGAKPVTIFVYKSKVTGFDVTLLNWFRTIDQVPAYTHQYDYVSDYMVDVLIVQGDWTNYAQLSIDPNYGTYFDKTGLIKTQADAFSLDTTIPLVSYYTGLSLIPYFIDQNGKDIFVQSAVNNDSDKTGIFAAFNVDAVDQTYNTGLIDLIGNTLINSPSSQDEINFLSYHDSIVENVIIPGQLLDEPGNVFSLTSIYRGTDASERTANFMEGYVGSETSPADVSYIGTLASQDGTPTSYSSATGADELTFQFQVNPGAYAIVGGVQVMLNTTSSPIIQSLEIKTSDFPITASTTFPVYFSATFTIGSNGVFNVLKRIIPYSTQAAALNDLSSVNASDIVMGYVPIRIEQVGSAYNFTQTTPQFQAVTIGNGGTPVAEPVSPSIYFGFNSSGVVGFVDLTSSGINPDYSVTVSGNSLTYTFLNTGTNPSVINYVQYRRFKLFNYISTFLTGLNVGQMSIIGDNREKYSLSGMTVTVVTTTLSNKSFTINTGNIGNYTSLVASPNPLLLYIVDNEFIVGEYGFKTTTDSANIALYTIVGLSGSVSKPVGVVGEYSTYYSKYYNGFINSGDYFYQNLLNDGGKETSTTVEYLAFNGVNYIVFSNITSPAASSLYSDMNPGEQLLVPSSTYNGIVTIKDGIDQSNSLYTQLGGAPFTASLAFIIDESITPEIINDATRVENADTPIYLNMFIDTQDDLNVLFTDSGLQIPVSIKYPGANFDLLVVSQISNFKESVEIETPPGSEVFTPNQILVLTNRYANIKAGDYLQAFVDPTTLQPGEVPRNITRVLSKKLWTVDPTFLVITCDARIANFNLNDSTATANLQTYRITQIDNYVSTYKGFLLDGFTMRTESMPDGTDERQSSILDIVAIDTPLFNALVNKDALSFRYLIDSFGLGLTENSKQQLVDICGQRLDVFGIINMPSMKQFKKSVNPSFIDANGQLSIQYVAAGGDPDTNPLFLYSFGNGNGNTCVGYFTPYVTINDNGRSAFVPPAAYVGTTYMKKQIAPGPGIFPWTVSAGVNNGIVQNIIGTEFAFAPTDIDYLNQARMNPIVFRKNRGYNIETENTALTIYKSTLSYIHSREVLIELEALLGDMLLTFQWKQNTADIRSEIKSRADAICQNFVLNNGLFNYFNKCDDENNTTDLIDNQIGVLDTYVEISKNLEILVNNITILRTGAIASGGFLSL